MVRAELRRLLMAGDPRHQPRRVGEMVLAERHRRALDPGIDLFDAGFAAQFFQGDDLQQVLHLVRQGPEAVGQLGGEGVYLVTFRQPGQAPV